MIWSKGVYSHFIPNFFSGPVRTAVVEHSAPVPEMVGRLIDFGAQKEIVEELIRTGKPFQTSGCPGRLDDISACNRPYGDSMPADIRSFPFALKAGDVNIVQRQMAGEEIPSYEDGQ